jgi:hypothetical protein
VRYIEKLQAVRRNPISTADIGVVTPYHKQVILASSTRLLVVSPLRQSPFCRRRCA